MDYLAFATAYTATWDYNARGDLLRATIFASNPGLGSIRDTRDYDSDGRVLRYETRLMQNQRFAEARRWFHYIFDPTHTGGETPERFWKIKASVLPSSA